MASQVQGSVASAGRVVPRGVGRQALYVLLGFSAGLPFYMFSTVLMVRLAEHGVALAIIGFFAWVQLLPTFKFLWAPLLDRYDVPGFARFWGKGAAGSCFRNSASSPRWRRWRSRRRTRVFG